VEKVHGLPCTFLSPLINSRISGAAAPLKTGRKLPPESGMQVVFYVPQKLLVHSRQGLFIPDEKFDYSGGLS
jgi:hypothetical protein